MASARPSEQVQHLVAAGRFSEAASTLISSADAGDADALYTLATWRISGQIIARDTAAARELMGKAAEAGHRPAKLLFAHFLGNGTGGPADWGRAYSILQSISGEDPAAAEQLQMLSQMAVDGNGNPVSLPQLETLSRSPAVWTCSGFLTDEECAYVVRKARPRLQASVVTERATGRTIPHPVRRSDGTSFGVATEDLVISALNRRIAAASGTRSEQGEPLQVLRYGPGGEFRPHHDAGDDNQRILTALAYMSDEYDGGETRFVRTGLTFRGHRGDLLLFSNVTKDGQPDALAEHAGLPVRSGEKVIASRWIWREPPQFPPPAPILQDA